MREIKFRVWNPVYGMGLPIGIFEMTKFEYDDGNGVKTISKEYPPDSIFLQYTGLKDKNGSGDICFYEGDIVDLQGNLIGNRYEQTHLLENKSNLLIEGIGTKNWRSTEKEALDRGLGYSE